MNERRSERSEKVNMNNAKEVNVDIQKEEYSDEEYIDISTTLLLKLNSQVFSSDVST